MPNSSKTDFQPVSLFHHHFVSCAIPESCVRGCSINFVASKLSLVYLSLASGSLKYVSNCLSFLLLSRVQLLLSLLSDIGSCSSVIFKFILISWNFRR